MRKRFISEAVAKYAIYLVFAVTAFGFLFFWQSARGYSAAAQAPAGQAALTAAFPGASQPAAAAPSPSFAGGASLPSSSAGTAPARSLPPANLEDIATNRPHLPDEAALSAELERIRAWNVGFPDTILLEYMGEFHATAYCCEVYPHICGGNGVTASGTVPTQGLTCAADWDVLPPGTWLYIDGVGIRRVEDSGSAIKENRLDIAIDTHENALRWYGFGSHQVWVLYWPE